MPTIVVTGSRTWRDRGVTCVGMGERAEGAEFSAIESACERALAALLAERGWLASETWLFHGGASGADTDASAAARRLGMHVCLVPARWQSEGRAAGPLRNERMLDVARPDAVLAFRAPGESRGTDHAIAAARRLQLANTHLTLVRVIQVALKRKHDET